jgi:hypothetical protein
MFNKVIIINVSGSDNELQINEDKVGNADTEDEEVDT